MRCVCGHGRFLHRNGRCMAVVNPCGCEVFETEEQAQEGSVAGRPNTYDGRYNLGGQL